MYSFTQNPMQLWPGVLDGSYAKAAPVQVMAARVSGRKVLDDSGILWQQRLIALFERCHTRVRAGLCPVEAHDKQQHLWERDLLWGSAS